MMDRVRACIVGSARYTRPLDPTARKKFRALEAIGEFTVIGFSRDARMRAFVEHARFYLLPALPWPVLRYLELAVLGAVLALWAVLRDGVTVLIAQSPYEGVPAACAKMVAGWLGRRPALIVESHGDFEEDLFMQRRVWSPGLYRVLMRAAAGFALRQADALRGISQATAAQLARRAPGRPMVIFPAWTDIAPFIEVGAAADRPAASHVLFAGVLVPRKGIDLLIAAFADIARDHPQARLLIVGRPENRAYAAALSDQVRRLELEGLVTFVPEVPQPDLARRMGEACVVVLPSLSEGLGRVVLEAMATGTPVIGSRTGGIPDLVEDGMTGFLVPPGDAAALGERLRWALEHPAEARVMGRHGRAAAARAFSPAAYVDGYAALFAAVRRPPSPPTGPAAHPRADGT